MIIFCGPRESNQRRYCLKRILEANDLWDVQLLIVSATYHPNYILIYRKHDTTTQLRTISIHFKIVQYRRLAINRTNLGVVPVQNLNTPSSVKIR